MEEEVKKQNVEQAHKKTKIRKVGRLTFGITLILFGLSIFLQTFVSMDVLKYVLMLWPLVFVSLGIEVICYSRRDDVSIKYDGVGIILMFVILFFGTIFSTINYGVNKILYNQDVASYIAQEMQENTRSFTTDSKVVISNLNEQNINVKILEKSDYELTNVVIRAKYKLNDNVNLIAFFNGNYNMGNFLEYYRGSKQDNESSYITIEDYPNYLESLEIVITTNNKENIAMNGNFKNVD